MPRVYKSVAMCAAEPKANLQRWTYTAEQPQTTIEQYNSIRVWW